MRLWGVASRAALAGFAVALVAFEASAQGVQAPPTAAARPAQAAPETIAAPRPAPDLATAQDDRARYVAIVRREAEARGLPPDVAEAVAHVESRFQPGAVGTVGEIGLMQIRPSTAAMLGHDGGALALFDPATNARFAVRYLATAWTLADGDLCRALMKYRAGHGAEIMSPLSARYCLSAKAYLARLGSPLADGVAPETVAIRDAPGDLAAPRRTKKAGPYLGWRPGRHSGADVDRFWAAHAARIKTLEARIAKRRKVRVARGG